MKEWRELREEEEREYAAKKETWRELSEARMREAIAAAITPAMNANVRSATMEDEGSDSDNEGDVGGACEVDGVAVGGAAAANGGFLFFFWTADLSERSNF